MKAKLLKLYLYPMSHNDLRVLRVYPATAECGRYDQGQSELSHIRSMINSHQKWAAKNCTRKPNQRLALRGTEKPSFLKRLIFSDAWPHYGVLTWLRPILAFRWLWRPHYVMVRLSSMLTSISQHLHTGIGQPRVSYDYYGIGRYGNEV